MTPAALVLDLDGTIVDTESAVHAACADEYARIGLALDTATMAAIVASGWDGPGLPVGPDARHGGPGPVEPYHVALALLAEAIGPGFDLAESVARVGARHRARVRATPLRPGIAHLVGAARAAGLPVAVASSSPRAWVDGNLARTGLAAAVRLTCCAEDVDRGRPHPDVYLLACGRLGVTPPDALAVEDSARGVRAAVDAGLFCVAATNPLTAGHDVSAAQLRLTSLDDVGWPDLVAAHRTWRDTAGTRQPTRGCPA